jgi:hypothetical protein
MSGDTNGAPVPGTETRSETRPEAAPRPGGRPESRSGERPAARAEGVANPFAGLLATFEQAVSRALAKTLTSVINPYQSAVIRIGYAATWLFFLLREFPHRDELYGPNAPWSWDLAHHLITGNDAFTVLTWTRSGAWFQFVYVLAILAAGSLLVGWRTRTSSVMFMVTVLSLQNRSVFEGDGGDNVIHLMAIYLVLTRCGEVWSLDSRRRARLAARASAAAAAGPAGAPGADAGTAPASAAPRDLVGIVLWVLAGAALVACTVTGGLGWGWGLILWGLWAVHAVWWLAGRYTPGEPRRVLDIFGNLIHNGALLVIMVQVILIYATAGWYKIQGSRWQDGTALYYPLHLDDFTPWPALSHFMASHGLMVMIISYGTVIVQVAFPFTVFNRRLKNCLLVLMIIEHISIAIVLGLPFFSLAMITSDAVFLPTNFLRWLGDRVTRQIAARRGTDPEGDAVPSRAPAPRRSPEAAPTNLVG